MASEAVLKELFEVAKTSHQFTGMSDDNIWKACLDYEDRSDKDLRIAMDNIRKKDQEELSESEEKQAKLKEGKKRMIELHKQEEVDHKNDEKNAEQVLADLFN